MTQLIDELPDFIPAEHWQAFLDMRKSIKKAPTEFAKRLLIKKLAQFKQAGEDLEKVLEQSIVNNWTDLYSAKGKQKNPYETQAEKSASFMKKLTGRKNDGNDPDIIDIN
jgi:hypothetical protein